MEPGTLHGDLCRYREEYQWNWGLTHKLINRLHGTSFTIPELKRYYAALKAHP